MESEITQKEQQSLKSGGKDVSESLDEVKDPWCRREAGRL